MAANRQIYVLSGVPNSTNTDKLALNDVGVFNGMLYTCTNPTTGSATFNRSNSGRTTFSKATINVSSTDVYVAQIGNYTPGVDTPGATLVNLPNASTVPAGTRLVIADESGTIRPWYRLNITPFSTQTIDGENIYSNLYFPYGMISLISNGLNGWNIENIKPIGTAVMSPFGKRSQYCYENELPLGGGNYQPGDIRVNGTGAAVQAFSDGTFAAGAAQLAGGTGTGHNSSIVSGGVASSRLRIGNMRNRWCEYNIRVDNLPDATNDAIIRIGYSDSTSNSAPSNGVFFNLIRSVDNSNWTIRTTDNTISTTTVTSVPFAFGTFQRFGIDIKDDLLAAYFFIDDVLVGTLTSNIPIASRQVSLQVAMIWVAGGTTRTITVDRIREHFIVNSGSLRVV